MIDKPSGLFILYLCFVEIFFKKQGKERLNRFLKIAKLERPRFKVLSCQVLLFTKSIPLITHSAPFLESEEELVLNITVSIHNSEIMTSMLKTTLSDRHTVSCLFVFRYSLALAQSHTCNRTTVNKCGTWMKND